MKERIYMIKWGLALFGLLMLLTFQVHFSDRAPQFLSHPWFYTLHNITVIFCGVFYLGMRKKADTDEQIPALVDTDISKKEFRRSWSRLIQKVYNANPLICPKCSKNMRIISFIEELSVIKVILKHLNLWETNNHDPPEGKIKRGYVPEINEAPDYINSPDNFHYFDDVQAFYDDDYSDPPFEDDYSQICVYADYVE